jgi:putative heme transporter
MPGAHVRDRDSRPPLGGDPADVASVPPVGESGPLDARTPGAAASAVDASRLTVSEEGPTVPITRARLVLVSALIVVALVGLYLLIPKLAGLKHTWGQLRRGDPLWLAVGAALELLSIAGYATLFRTVFGRGVPRIDWRASLQIPLAGIAAIRLVAAAGAGGVAVTAWALGRAGMSAEVIACRIVASLVIQYSVYLGAVIVCGLGLWAGVFGGGGSVAITLFPAVLAAVLAAAVLSLALMPDDIEQRLKGFAGRTQTLGAVLRRLAKAPDTLGSGVRTARDLVRERRLGLLGAVAYWGFDIAVLGVCFDAFGRVVPVAVLVMGYFLGTLGSLLPLPGGIGGVEGGMIGAFVAFGVPVSSAVVAVLAYRAISFWLPTLPGIAGYLALRSTVRGWRAADAEHVSSRLRRAPPSDSVG